MKAASLELLERIWLITIDNPVILQAMEAELAERDNALATKQDLRDLRTELREESRSGFDELDLKIESVRCDLRAELGSVRSELIRWNFAFWIAQLAAVVGLLKLLR